MKIGFFGNTNNYPFTIARAMRRLGHEVLFIVDRSRETTWEMLYRPENRYSDISLPYPDWIHDVSPFNFWHDKNDAKKVKHVVSLLKSCDVVYLNQNGPSLLPYIQKPAIVHLTGSDLEVLANPRYPQYQIENYFPLPKLSWWKLRAWKNYFRERSRIKNHFLELVNNQRQGIASAVTVVYFPQGMIPNGDKMLSDLKVNASKRIFFYLSDLEYIKYCPSPKNKKIRIFNVARLNWISQTCSFVFKSVLDNKRTDVLLKGICRFCKETKIEIDLRLVKKGNDVEATQKLADDLGLSGQITWLDELSQLEVLEEYCNADIVTENLGEGQWGMGAMDAMITGRPVIANAHTELIQSVLGESPPICHAQTPEEVCNQLKRLVLSTEEREEVGKASRLYAETYFSAENAAKLCLERLRPFVKDELS